MSSLIWGVRGPAAARVGVAVLLGMGFSGTPAVAQTYLAHDQPLAMAQRNIPVPADMRMDLDSPLADSDLRTTPPVILPRSVWNANETSGTGRSHRLNRVTLHHEASPRPAVEGRATTSVIRNLQTFSQTQRPWCDVPYHYFVDVDGSIYEGRDPLVAGDTNTKYDPAVHLLICALGNFEIQAPGKAQLDAITALMAYGCEKYGLDPATISSHRDHALTACPGRYLFSYVASGFFEGEVRESLRSAYRENIRTRDSK